MCFSFFLSKSDNHQEFLPEEALAAKMERGMGPGTHMGSFPPWGLLVPHSQLQAGMVWGHLRGRSGAATCAFQWCLKGSAWLSAGTRAVPWLGWAGWGSCSWVLLVQGHPAVVVVASGHLCPEPVWPVPRCGCELWAASQHRDLDNLVGSHQFMPERELCATQCNQSLWKVLEGIIRQLKNKKSRSW